MDGEAADPVAWLRTAITERLELARKAALCGEVKDGRWFADDDQGNEVCDDNGWRILAAVSGSYVALHVEASDPQDTIARCETELAILDEHGPTDWTAYGDHMCCRCHRPREEAREDEEQCEWLVYPCRTVRLLLGAYRFRNGYDEKWGALT